MSAPRSLPAGLKKYAGTVTGNRVFGIRRKVNNKWTREHDGCDFATPEGIPLEAGLTGTVVAAGGSPTHEWGYYVHIRCRCPRKHEQQFHVLRDKPTLKRGDEVNAGDVIGHTGRSGAFNGKGYDPHHHHATRDVDGFFDPLTIGWPAPAGTTTPPLELDTKEATMRYFHAPGRGGMVTTEVGGVFYPATPEEAVALSKVHDGLDVTAREWDVLRQAALNRNAAHVAALKTALGRA